MKKRYAYLINPLMLLIDIIIINSVVVFVDDKNYLLLSFFFFINIFWIISSIFSGYYKISRTIIFFRILSLCIRQFALYVLGFFTYFTLFREGEVVNNQTVILSTTFIAILIFKLLFIYALKVYRSRGNNFKNVVVLGGDASIKPIVKLLKDKKEFGYHFFGYFSNKSDSENNYLGKFNSVFKYVLEYKIDEIYCSLSELTTNQINQVKKFAIVHDIDVRLIPNANELYSKNLKSEFYDDSLLILKVNKLPFDSIQNRLIKRSFDIVFSLFVMVFLLSWLTPLLWIIIKLESKGPVFFLQHREGLNGDKFLCFKFRSMKPSVKSMNTHTTKNDARVTKVGTFLRKTSLDEMPQFFNVFLGNMSIVGPRPHIESLSIEYQKDVENYIHRHAVKPGITGLAQVSGFRGEIKKKSDIRNRIRMDIFYIENWSFLLDIKIIIRTILNIFKGDENAY